jgi:hypothetical protein
VAGTISGGFNAVGGVVGKGLNAVGIEAGAATGNGVVVNTGAGITETTGGVVSTVGGGAPAAGMSVGKAMLIGTGVQAAGALYQGYEQKKAEEAAKKEQDDAYYYGMNGKGQYAQGFSANGVSPNLQSNYYPPIQRQDAQLIAPRQTLLNRAAYQPIRTA